MRQQPTDVGVHVFYGGLWNLHSVNAPLLLRDWGPSEKKYDSTSIRLVVDADRAARPLRGGSWFNSAQHALEARRNELFPLHRDGNLGLRLVVDTDGERVFRGGSRLYTAFHARATRRGRSNPGNRGYALGFRLTVDTDGDRVYRGGSWIGTPDLARAAFRRRLFPDFRLDYLGLRLIVDNSHKNTITTKAMA